MVHPIRPPSTSRHGRSPERPLTLKPTMRQVHVAGEKLFVDYSGHTMEVIDGLTGEVFTAQIFVAVLGASNYTYAEATFTQSLPDWISAHVRAFFFFGGAARQTVSDNSKGGHHTGLLSRTDDQPHLC
jgi:transposase